MPDGPVVVVFRYTSPIVSVVWFLGINFYFACQSTGTGKGWQRRLWRRPSLWLSWTIAAAYLVQSLLVLSAHAEFCKDAHIHTLAEALLWTTLALSLADSPSPVSRPYLSTWILTLVLEMTSAGISLTTSRLYWPSFAVQVSALVLMAGLSILALVPLRQDDADDADERRPLMSPSRSSDVSQEYDSPSYHRNTISECGSDSDDDEEDKEVKQLQQERLRTSGGWVGYLKDFAIFWQYIWPSGNMRLTLAILVLFVNIFLTRALNVLTPRQLGLIINRLTTERQIPWSDVGLWGLFGLLASDSTGLGALNEMIERRISIWSFQRLGLAAFDQVMRLSMDFHDEKDSGEIIKALEQATSLNSLLQIIILEVFPGVLDVFIALWYVAYVLDGYAVLMVLSVAVAFTFITSYITVFVNASRRDLSVRQRGQSKLLYETISHWSVVSYFNRRGYEKARLSGVLKGIAEADLRSNDHYIYLYGAQEFCEQVGKIAIVLLAAHRAAQGLASIGTLIAVESYWDTITMPLYVMGHSYRQLSTDLIDAERLLQLFKLTPTVQDIQGARPIDVHAGKVEFEDVGFGYHKDRLALDHFTFQALPGQKIALVGETGSGKSTILKLLMRFYDVGSGRILIDGQDVRHVTQDSLREVFGVVPQETVLFNTTVLDNVRYARLDATDEEVFEACRAAAIHDKILTFSHGYHTKVGERGIKLSGGEMQRLSIARVLLKRPRIVLLDEATSAIDTITESKIQVALHNLTDRRTTFVIAHRLSTVVDADVVLVIDQGRIIEQGTHQQLLLNGNRYKELWMRQSQSQVDKVEDPTLENAGTS
ncbi:hypothetical protein PV08_11716 [Exophiala spinifera]|uniref:ABC transporter domain-containing protein n=1 Tax=Exophiala spinifera TaxID=91928 RepID=A0A0D2ATY7_9EURO|nr:uncharacterized protein PV08_11716 [Exophiala spinifera]KIW09940.1 hypothetical protein PV08_11716 [Exophiala spinifera]